VQFSGMGGGGQEQKEENPEQPTSDPERRSADWFWLIRFHFGESS
jgi:hypothetical protein